MGKNADKRLQREQGALESVATPPLTLGRIVQFNIGTKTEPKLRATICIDELLPTVHVYLVPGDLPFAPGTGLKLDAAGNAIAAAKEGEGMGEWRWPVIENPYLPADYALDEDLPPAA